MKLAEKGIIPELDNYKPLARNKYGETLAILLAQKEIIPLKCWMHDINIQDKYGLSIKTILQNRQLPVPQHWQNEEEMTIFDQACFRIIPDITGHKSDEQNEDGFTVAMILTINNINIPVEWQHDPNIQNKYKYTVAMHQARNGHIPDKIWYHNKYLRCKYQVENNPNSFMDRVQFYTVQNILQRKNIQVPQEWKYTSLDEEENNQAIIDTKNGIIPKLGNNNTLYQNIYGQTVAIILASKGIIPPREWMHDIEIKNVDGLSIKLLLQDQHLPVPQHWKDNNMNIFDQACFGIIPKLDEHKPEEQDEDGFTIAMILSILNKEVPECWYHDSKIRNKYGYTVAMIQAMQGKIPDKQWTHDKYLRCKYSNKQYFTVQNILQDKNIEVPEEWKYVPLNKDEDTQAMIYVDRGIIPKIGSNEPQSQNIDGYTVAMKLALKGIIPPRQWMHDFSIENYIQFSLITYLQMNQLPVPQHWQNEEEMTIFDKACFKIIPSIEGHKPEEQDQDGFTVAMILAINKIQIPEEWKYDKVIKNKYEQTLQDMLKNDQKIQKEQKEQKFAFEEQCIFNTQKLIKQSQELIQEK